MFKFNDHHAKTDCKGQKVGDRSCIKYAHNAEKMRQCNDKRKQEQDLSGQGEERKVPLYAFPMELKNIEEIGCKKFNQVKNRKARK